MSRLVQDDLSGTCRKLIGAMLAAVIRKAVVFAVWDSLTVAAVGPEPKDGSWETLEVQRREVAAVAVTAEAMLRME